MTGFFASATSRGYSYYFREMISLCTIDMAYSEIGTEVTVIWGEPAGPQKKIRAKAAPAPYKRITGKSTSIRLSRAPSNHQSCTSPRLVS
ncbi:MAG: hypothetical protein QGF09_15760 [Rhodospirillales bacterium]|nr:hypothetical protein [Rhodospirillales bacterium]